jgi:hypothetical protein
MNPLEQAIADAEAGLTTERKSVIPAHAVTVVMWYPGRTDPVRAMWRGECVEESQVHHNAVIFKRPEGATEIEGFDDHVVFT